MDRRRFLALSALGLLPTPSSRAQQPALPQRRRGPAYVSSDVGRLKRVLVHEPGAETRKALTIAGANHPLESIDLVGVEANTQHRELVAGLKQAGAEVIQFREALASALEAARAADAFDGWLAAALPHLVDVADQVSADVLIGSDDRFVYHRPEGDDAVRPLITPLKFLLYVRDLAVMTPRGLVLGSLGTLTRDFEVSLLRLALQWAPQLRGYPIAFDAQRQGLQLQGGDLIVADERTLLLGVGNLTEEAVAKRLAQRLRMDVIAVQLPGGDGFDDEGHQGRGNSLRLPFLHLDSFLNLVGPRRVLTIPYFLEQEFGGKDPLTRLLQGLAQGPGVEVAYLQRLAESLAGVGRVHRYRARTGERDPTIKDLKIVDYLRTHGYEIVPVAGPAPAEGPAATKHVVEHLLPELRHQAANVVAVAPDRLLSVAGNRLSLEALRAAKVNVQTFPGSELVRWHGGAHCLTLPLERDPVAG